VSNEQSPPPRKVIPYKKGGRRPSPFAGMALQFSGTALDVAIQQRDQESEASPSPGEEQPAEEMAETQSDPLSANKVQQVEETLHVSETSPSQEAHSVYIEPAVTDDSTRNKEIHLVNSKKTSSRPVVANRKISPPSISDSSFQAFVERWKPGLHRGQLKMCEVLFNKTYAVGRTDCETSFSVLMRESGLSRRQSFQVISELEKMGFVERLTTPKHSTRKGTGSHIRLHLTPKT
jgi:hypothetical protein